MSECQDRRQSTRKRFSLRALFAGLLPIALLCVILRWGVMQSARERKNDTVISFKMVGRSLEIYNRLFGHLPYPTRYETPNSVTVRGTANGHGKPLYSWRAEVAQLADSWFGDRPWDQSKAWNDPANRIIASFPWRYSYDAVGLDASGRLPSKFSSETNIMAIIGPGTAFGCEEEAPARLFQLDDDTILAVETRNSGIHWMQPGDFDIRDMPRTINASHGKGISSRYDHGFHVVFADGQVWFLSNKVPFETLEKFFTVSGATQVNREALLQPYRIE